MAWNGFYATDGSMNITVVSGSTYTGVYATDGSINVIASPGNAYVGAYHPCGAWYVTENAGTVTSLRAPDGSLNISQSPYTSGTQRTTIVTGGFTPGTGALIPLLAF